MEVSEKGEREKERKREKSDLYVTVSISTKHFWMNPSSFLSKIIPFLHEACYLSKFEKDKRKKK